MVDFCIRLRQERKRLGLSQEKFSALGGVTRDTQMNYENGSRKPDSSYLTAIALAGVDVLFLLTGETANMPLTAEESELLASFRSLDLRGKVNLLGMADVMGKTAGELKKPEVPVRSGSQFLGTVKAKHVTQGDQHIAGDFNNGDSKKVKKPKKNLEE